MVNNSCKYITFVVLYSKEISETYENSSRSKLMKIVIIGGGKVGAKLASSLSGEEHDIVVIDNSRSVIQKLGDAYDVLAMYGNGATLTLQKQADVEHADLLIAVTSQDELNMMCCIMARKLGCQNTIARVRNPEYAKQMYFLREELGLSMSVNPEASAAREISRLLQFPGVIRRDSFAKGRMEIVELDVVKGDVFDGVFLYDLPKKLKTKVLVCAIQRDGSVKIPDGNVALQAGDRIHVTAPTAELVALTSMLTHEKTSVFKRKATKDVMLIGGSRITQYLAESLLKTGTNVKIIEMDLKRCHMLAELLPKATVINADGSNQEVLRSENMEQMDAVVSLTNMDEENLIISMYAKHKGVPQVITKLNRTEYAELFREKGIDRIVSPKQLSAQEIIRYVRAMQNTDIDSIISVHQMVEGKIEALEFRVTEKTKYHSIPLKDLKIKPNILISSINHHDKVVIAGGNDLYKPGDTVVVVSLANRVILDLNDIFMEA